MDGPEHYAPPKPLQDDLVSDKSRPSINEIDLLRKEAFANHIKGEGKKYSGNYRERRESTLSTASELIMNNELELKIETFANNIKEEGNKNSGNYNKAVDGKKKDSFLSATCRQDFERRNLPSWISDKTAPIFNSRHGFNKRNIMSFFEISIKLFVEHGVYAFLAIALALILSRRHFFGDITPGTACVANGDNTTLLENTLVDGYSYVDICRLEIILKRYQKNLGTLVAFILGGFVSSTIYLWRLRRNNYCVLCGGARNLIIQIGAILPQANDEESLNRRKTMLRWVVLGFELAVLKGRNMIDTAEGRYHLDYLGLLKWDEWDKLIDGDRHTTVWWWIQAKSSQLQSEGVITGLKELHLCNVAAQMRDKANDLMSRIDRDESIPYTTIVGLLVNVNLLNFTLWTGVHWAIFHYNSGGKCWIQFSMHVEILFFLLYNIMFSVLFDLSQILYNPFGPRSIDISHNVVSRGIQKLAREVAKCDFPSSMKPNNQIDSEDENLFYNEPSNITHENRRPPVRKRFSLLGTMRNITIYE